MCLAGRGLSIGKDGPVVAGQDVGYDRLGGLIEDLLLGRIRLEDLVEEVDLALQYEEDRLNGDPCHLLLKNQGDKGIRVSAQWP